jgi:hypothetical protein
MEVAAAEFAASSGRRGETAKRKSRILECSCTQKGGATARLTLVANHWLSSEFKEGPRKRLTTNDY